VTGVRGQFHNQWNGSFFGLFNDVLSNSGKSQDGDK
jgi:hypothetical protein